MLELWDENQTNPWDETNPTKYNFALPCHALTFLGKINVKMLVISAEYGFTMGVHVLRHFCCGVPTWGPTFLLWPDQARSMCDKNVKLYTVGFVLSQRFVWFYPEALTCSGVKWHKLAYFLHVFLIYLETNWLWASSKNWPIGLKLHKRCFLTVSHHIPSFAGENSKVRFLGPP